MNRDGSSGGVAYIVTIDEHNAEEKVILGNDLPTFFDQWPVFAMYSNLSSHYCASARSSCWSKKNGYTSKPLEWTWLMSCSVKWNLHLNKNYMQKLHFTFTFLLVSFITTFSQNITGNYRNYFSQPLIYIWAILKVENFQSLSEFRLQKVSLSTSALHNSNC